MFTIKINVILLVSSNERFDSFYKIVNNEHLLGRSRWVQYADRVGLDYDASQVPPEW